MPGGHGADKGWVGARLGGGLVRGRVEGQRPEGGSPGARVGGRDGGVARLVLRLAGDHEGLGALGLGEDGGAGGVEDAEVLRGVLGGGHGGFFGGGREVPAGVPLGAWRAPEGTGTAAAHQAQADLDDPQIDVELVRGLRGGV